MDDMPDGDEVRNSDGSIPLKEFSEMRDKCRALREVLLPDSIWQQFRDWHTRPDDEAAHRSVLLLAYRRGCLSSVTKPIHRYLLSSSGIRADVRKQYVQDLRERWMLADDPVERNRLSKIFRGRIVELQLALRLEGQSHRVVGLEATRKGPDIETASRNGVHSSWEVKFIGVEDGDFRIFLESIAGLPAATWVSPYTAMNYLVFRVYEAARQLRSARGTKAVVVVIDDTAWFRFEMQLIDWKNPRFISQDSEWTRFLEAQRERYPDLPNDLASTIQEVDSIRIFRQTSRFGFIFEYDVSAR